MLQRIPISARAIRNECQGALRVGGDAPSVLRLVLDVVLSRVLRLVRLPDENRPRTIRLRSGDRLTYRLNRGDIQSIREVLFDEVYRLPFELQPRTVVDLGANIGLTSLYYTRLYAPNVLVAVEADTKNAELTRLNIAPLGHYVTTAAIGPTDGTTHFAKTRDSNLGSVSDSSVGTEVPMVSMATLLATHNLDTVDLLKLDIEGGEQALLDGDLAWLSQVNAIVAEFHPEVVDYAALVQRLVDNGFVYVPAGTAWPNQMDAFMRTDRKLALDPGAFRRPHERRTIAQALKQSAKTLLPQGLQFRRLPSGIGRGLRLALDLRGGHIGLYLGLYEVELNSHLRKLCYPGALCFDIGGSIGYDALVLAKLSRSKVVTVEASSDLCHQITANVHANWTLASSVSVVNAYVDRSSVCDGHITVDDLAEQHFVPDFIKIDTEGGEVDTLRGAAQTLGDRRPGLLIEVHSAELEAECIALLRGFGYIPTIVEQRRFLRDHRPTDHNRWIIADGAPV